MPSGDVAAAAAAAANVLLGVGLRRARIGARAMM